MAGRNFVSRASVWMVSLWIGLQTLSPVYGIDARRGSLPAEICTLTGIRLLPAGGVPDPSPVTRHGIQHCTLCSIVGGTIAPPMGGFFHIVPFPSKMAIGIATLGEAPANSATLLPVASRAPPVPV